MRTKLVLSLLLLFITGSAWADGVITDVISLKDGTVCEGYIRSQTPGKGLVIYSARTTYCVETENVKNVTVTETPLKQLPQAWQAWAEEHPSAVVVRNKEKSLAMASFDLTEKGSKTPAVLTPLQKAEAELLDSLHAIDSLVISEITAHVANVFILEEGLRMRYVMIAETELAVSRADIASIRPVATSPDLLSGFNDIIELQNGKTVTGSIIENVPGVRVCVKTERGSISTCDAKDILVQRKEKKNEGQSELAQSPLIETLQLTNGKTVEGLIVEQQYGNAVRSSNVVVVDAEGVRTVVPNNTISKVVRSANPHYEPAYNLHIQKGELFANGKKLAKANVSKEKKTVAVSPEAIAQITLDGTKNQLVVKALQDTANEPLYLVRVDGQTVKGTYKIDAEQLLANSIPVAEKSTDDGVTSWTFQVEDGDFVIYQPALSSAYLLRIGNSLDAGKDKR